jgi:hypothetical protein
MKKLNKNYTIQEYNDYMKKCRKKYNEENFNTDKFIEKSNVIHNNKYTYPDKYIDAHTKIKIICPVHGIFEQRPNDHLSSYGCIKCSGRYSKKDECVETFNQIHNYKFDYSLMDYKNNKTKIKIICPKHGVFEQKPDHHLQGVGCPKCAGKNKTTEEFNKIANEIHNNKYTYPDEYINSLIKIKIICPIHGIFEQTPSAHINNKYGCSFCDESKGEISIKQFLNDKNIIFESEKRFKECRNVLTLPFDFYLPNYNTCIEFDGKQHFEPIKYFGGEKEFKKLQKRDQIKNEYCKNNNIHLIRIKYNENIKEKLKFLID